MSLLYRKEIKEREKIKANKIINLLIILLVKMYYKIKISKNVNTIYLQWEILFYCIKMAHFHQL